LPEEEAHAGKHGIATFLAFVVAGVVPLVPYLLAEDDPFPGSVLATFAALFAIGAARSLITTGRWWRNGLEMFALGAIVAVAAFVAGAIVAFALT
jgi:VIT1/CCC1 family predicted Fe2+/Mn2+ transporter